MKKIHKTTKASVKTFEDTVMNSIYEFEKKRTTRTVFVYGLLLLLVILFIGYLGYSIYETLKAQQTLDLLDLFQENSSVIRKYFFDIASTFYEELPQVRAALFFLAVCIFVIVTFLFSRNFSKIKKRFISIHEYFNHNSETK